MSIEWDYDFDGWDSPPEVDGVDFLSIVVDQDEEDWQFDDADLLDDHYPSLQILSICLGCGSFSCVCD